MTAAAKTDTRALIVIDVQTGFCPGGNLAVPGGDEIVPGINALMVDFDHVILTQDWHPAGHSSFASSHPGRAPYDVIDMPHGALARSLHPGHAGRRVPPRPAHRPRPCRHPQGLQPRRRQLFRVFRERS